MTEETNGAKKEETKDAQDERPNLRRQILLWAAALLGGLMFFLLGKYEGWTGYYAFAVSCILIPLFSERHLDSYKKELRRWKWGFIAVGAAALGLLEGPESFEWAVGWLRRYESETNLWTFCWRIALECVLVGIVLRKSIEIFNNKFKLGWEEAKKHGIAHLAIEIDIKSFPEEIMQIMTAPSAGEAWKRYLTRFIPAAARSDVRAPIEETLIYQAIPIALLSIAGASFGTQVVVSMILFALAHFVNNSIGTGIIAGIRGGFYFAFVYSHWRRVSFWRAFWTTSLVHALHNSAFSVYSFISMLVVMSIVRSRLKKSGTDRDELIKSVEEKEGEKSESAKREREEE